MRIVAFNGSPRGLNGNTHRIVDAFLSGAKAAGAETESIVLASHHVEHCRGCFNCWGTTPGQCVHDDDVQDLLERFMAADLVVLATPIYTDSVTSILKKFLERILPLLKPDFEVAAGETRHLRRHERYPDFVIISNCGYPEYSQFQVISHLFQRLSRELDVHVVLEIYRTMGELLNVDHLLVKSLVKRYLNQVREAGKQLARNGSVDDGLVAALREPLIPENVYRNRANAYWQKKLRRLS